MRYNQFCILIINRIRELADDKGISINHLCKISNVSNSTISKFFNDPNASITVDTLEKLCIGLSIGIDKFFDTPDFN